jgi:hypothetical protein
MRSSGNGLDEAMSREPPVTAQAQAIIDVVLADSDPSLAEVQRSLRKSVALHPGCPISALLAHLLEIRWHSNSGS